MHNRRLSEVLAGNRLLGEERVVASLQRDGGSQVRARRVAADQEAFLKGDIQRGSVLCHLDRGVNFWKYLSRRVTNPFDRSIAVVKRRWERCFRYKSVIEKHVGGTKQRNGPA